MKCVRGEQEEQSNELTRMTIIEQRPDRNRKQQINSCYDIDNLPESFVWNVWLAVAENYMAVNQLHPKC